MPLTVTRRYYVVESDSFLSLFSFLPPSLSRSLVEEKRVGTARMQFEKCMAHAPSTFAYCSLGCGPTNHTMYRMKREDELFLLPLFDLIVVARMQTEEKVQPFFFFLLLLLSPIHSFIHVPSFNCRTVEV